MTKTHSRPHISNDNPFSEAQFKTLKYRPAFPARLGSIHDARAHCHVFFPWYNTEHHHTGLGLLTPHDVHPSRTLPRWPSPAAGVPHGSLDQPTQHSGALAHRIEEPSLRLAHEGRFT